MSGQDGQMDNVGHRGILRADDEILTSREARELLKIGRTKLWELTRKNAFPAFRIGDGKTSSLRYRRSDLLAFLDQNRI